tara:strand:+ start:280 stop:1068 length:789 start_codon:yes stop_codon:yes gene_type:complete
MGGLLVDESHEEEFTSRKLKRRKAASSRAVVVQDSDFLTASIFENKVTVLGSEVTHFVQCYEQKLGHYLNKPFLRLLTDGALLRDLTNFKKYVLGTAICKHYEFPSKRFIEVQFHFHDEWKGDAPTIHYVTSLHSEWNSVGRYKDYCERFKHEIDYFGEGQDNLSASYRTQKIQCKPTTINTSLVAVYEDMIQFQEAAKGIDRKSALKLLGYPGKERLPFRYLKTLPLYMELVEEDAWGDTVKNIDRYRKLKIEIENLRYAG